VYINGNGANSGQKTQLIIEESTISGDGYGITGSGNANRNGTDIQIRKSIIKQNEYKEDGNRNGTGAAIFHPQANSTLTITEDSTIEGYTAIALKGGYVSISDSTVTGYGVVHMDPEKHASQSGFCDTADAVYIEANYNNDIRLEVIDSILTNTNSAAAEAMSLRVYKEDAPNVIVKIVSGTFDQEQKAAHLAEDSTQKLKDGKYQVTAK
jgi:hypothetical protein